MSDDDFWSSVYSGDSEADRPAGFSAIRIALLFGTAVIALAFMLPPMIELTTDDWKLTSSDPGIDYMTTATVRKNRQYRLQRSVVLNSVNSVCIIHADGQRSGDC